MEGRSRSAGFITEILGATIPRTANTSISRLWVWSYARNAPMQPLISCGGDSREPPNYSFAGQSGNEKREVVEVGQGAKNCSLIVCVCCNCRLIEGINPPPRPTSEGMNVQGRNLEVTKVLATWKVHCGKKIRIYHTNHTICMD